MRHIKLGALVVTNLALLFFPSPTRAQLASASAADLGTGGNFTSIARGVASLALNPAALGLSGNPEWSLAIFPLLGHTTLSPVSLSDLGSYSGKVVPTQVREGWLQEISSEGGESGGVGFDITPVAYTSGRLGFQVSTLVRAQTNLNDAAAELLLFGNAGRTGAAGDFDLSGSTIYGLAVSTLGLSVAFPIEDVYLTEDLLEESLSFGVTLKLSLGHGLVYGQDGGTVLNNDPLEVGMDFPVIQSDSSGLRANRGWGAGVDLGVAWAGGPWSVGLAAKNVVHTFEWPVEDMFFRPGQALFDGERSESDFEAISADNAPAALQEAVTELKFKPTLVAGGSYRVNESLVFSSDVRKRIGEGIDLGPDLHLGLGTVFSPFRGVSLQAGGAKISGGFQGGGGFGVKAGSLEATVAAMYQDGYAGERTLASFSVTVYSY